MHCGKLIAGQSPRSRRPRNQTRIGIFDQRKQHIDTRIGNFAITLTDFAGAKRCAALRPPPDDLVAFIEQTAVEQILEDVPNAFDIALVVRDVSVFQIDPETKSLGELFPILHVTPNTGLAFLDERFDAVCFDLFL